MSYERVVMTGYGDPNVLKVVEEAGMPEPRAGGAQNAARVRFARPAGLW